MIRIILGSYFAIALGAPVFFLLKETFVIDGALSVENFSVLMSDQFLLNAFYRSWVIATGATVLSVVVSLPIAMLFARMDFRGKGLWQQLILLPLFLPPFVGVLGIKAILGRGGALNETLLIWGVLSEPIDFLGAYRPLGIAVVQALHLFPLVVLSVASALSRINLDVLEAARVAGANRATIFIQVVLPLVFPALFSSGVLVFVGSFTDIGTPLLFEVRDTVAVVVFNMVTEIGGGGPGYALVTVIGVVGVVLFMVSRIIESSVPIQMYDRGFRPVPMGKRFGAWEWCAFLTLVGVMALALIGHGGVLITSLSAYWFLSPLPREWNFSHYSEVFSHPLAYQSVLTSVSLATAATVLNVFLGIAISWYAVRSSSRWAKLFLFLGMMPLVVPGIVFAFGYIVAFAGTPIDNRVNPLPLLVLAYSLRKLPFMIKIVESGLRQVSVSLEEAGYVFGASRLTVLKKITAPLLIPHIVAGGVLCFLGALLEVSDSLLLPLEERFYPIAKALYALQARPDGTPLACALGVILMVLVMGGMYVSARMSGKRPAELLKA